MGLRWFGGYAWAFKTKEMKSFLFVAISQHRSESIRYGNVNAHHRLPPRLASMIRFPNAYLRLLLCIPFICTITRAGWSAKIAPHYKQVWIGGLSLFQVNPPPTTHSYGPPGICSSEFIGAEWSWSPGNIRLLLRRKSHCQCDDEWENETPSEQRHGLARETWTRSYQKFPKG